MSTAQPISQSVRSSHVGLLCRNAYCVSIVCEWKKTDDCMIVVGGNPPWTHTMLPWYSACDPLQSMDCTLSYQSCWTASRRPRWDSHLFELLMDWPLPDHAAVRLIVCFPFFSQLVITGESCTCDLRAISLFTYLYFIIIVILLFTLNSAAFP